MEIKQNKQGIYVISGLASTYQIDRGDDRVMPGAFKRTIERHKRDNRMVRAYLNHDSSKMLGGIPASSMRETAQGLMIDMHLDMDTQLGKDTASLIKKGFLSDFSIGYSVIDFDLSNGVRELKEIELWEVSVVSEPMNPGAVITQKEFKSLIGHEYSRKELVELSHYQKMYQDAVVKKQLREISMLMSQLKGE